ncbi:hypothetical protein HPS54_03860 [Prevotella sp. PCHR]|uniref:Uncharacterized protein n=2 Tax=Xylanibacter caecicola TaxID=2736294 RepID=A0ABX2AZI3_9BACT|nr:hypothetical protein [Xylanibacter caecicola]NPE24659.1 hypothetical protein [Xylanibacter caecicola]
MKSKRFILVFLSLLFFASLFAESSKSVPAVTMVSYEQAWLDHKGTLALRNNLSEDIHNIVFQIIYMDISGNALDYEEFSKDVDIAPGMTRKIDIPAYEHGRHYHYYKTKDEFDNPAFKIKFKLKSYNENKVANASMANDVPDVDDDISGMDGTFSDLDEDNGLPKILSPDTGLIVLMLFIVFFVIALSVGLYVLVAVMAQRRNRSVVAWILISLIATPLLSIIILLFIGNDNNAEPL